jgi:hypothetical protein
MYLKGSSLAIIIFFLGIFAFQNDSDARKRGGIFFINFANETIGERKVATNEDFRFLAGEAAGISEGTDITALKPSLKGMKVGYKYTYCGIFWLELWTWGGEVVLYKDKSYSTINVDQAAAAKKYGKPFFYKFPPVLIAGVLFGGFWLMGMMSQGKSEAEKSGGSRPKASGMGGGAGSVLAGGGSPPPTASAPTQYTEEQLQQMYEDPRYQRALELLDETGSYQQPVGHLIENGIPESDAGSSLAALKKAIADSQG